MTYKLMNDFEAELEDYIVSLLSNVTIFFGHDICSALINFFTKLDSLI